MVHRWGLGSRVRRRAAVGAATALALVVLQTGTALADDPAPPAPTPGPPAPAAGGRVPSTVGLADGVVDLTTCALAVVGCPPTGPARLVCDLLPYVLGQPSGLPAPPVPPMATAPPAVSVDDRPSSGAAHLSGGDGVAPALDDVGLALGSAAPPATAVPASDPAPPPGPPALPPARDGAAPGLASTGMPVVAALAGLVLLAVGGCLTWARSRGRQT